MAKGGDGGDLVEIFKKFCSVGKSKEDENKFTTVAAKRLTKDCWMEHYKPFKGRTVADMVDGSVFMSMADKKKKIIAVDKDNVELFIKKVAFEICKAKHGSKSIDDKEVGTEMETLKGYIIKQGGPDTKTVKTSKVGNVDGLTDASKFTGASKERFDKDGKGKGIEGREDRTTNDGYVSNYKNKGTFDAKK